MKKTLILLIVAFIISFKINSQVQSGWYWVNPQPQGHNLTSVAYLNTNTIVAAGWNGTIIRSSNGGSNWSYFRYNTMRDFRKLKFADQNTGYAIGDSSLLLKTTDSGISWSRVQYYTNENFYDLYFFDTYTGYISTNSKILKTTNGGANFTQIIIPGYTGYYLQFTDPNTGYSGLSNIYKTTNSGANWIQVSNFTGFSCFFINNSTGFVGGDGQIAKTTNGGINWSTLSVPLTSNITSIKFFNENTGFAAGNNDYIIKTTNSGVSWISLPFQQPDIYANCVDIIDANNVVTVGLRGLIERSTNGGLTWSPLNKILYGDLTDISFANLNTGFAVGYKAPTNNSVLKTTNQGIDWFEVLSAPPINYFSVCFIDVNTGFAGGYESEIYKTTNSGTSWNLITLNENAVVYDIKFINTTTGFASSYATAIYMTTNTGINWIRVNYNTNGGHLQKISFPSNNTGYVVGESGLKTTNGGYNWFTLNRPSDNIYNYSVYFLDDNTGFIGGEYGQVSKTTNGGVNWITFHTNLPFIISEIKFINNSTGYISCALNISGDNYGGILRTTNGGTTWEKDNLPSNERLLSVYFINDLTGFLIGDDGTILKTTTGGEPIGISQISNEIPKNYFLQQNYPNPFNPTTIIKFDIPQRSVVKVSIYDILGKEISVLVNEELNPGTFEVNWDASNFPSGVYFYKIVSDDFTESKKMVLIK